MKYRSKFWAITERLLFEYAIHPMEKHEALFLSNVKNSLDQKDEHLLTDDEKSELDRQRDDSLTEAQKAWLLKMDTKYPTPEETK